MIQKPPLKRSQFTGNLVLKNSLDRSGFKEWVFCPGMMFNAEHKWWDGRDKRSSDHEGLDLFLYRNYDGEILRLDEGTEVPAIYDGTVVRVIDDFLGRSIFMEHANGLITAFGHTRPLAGIVAGTRMKEGDTIATIAEITDPKMKISPHLHISAGWISGTIPYVKLNWETIVTSDTIALIDPLELINRCSKALKVSSPVCRAL